MSTVRAWPTTPTICAFASPHPSRSVPAEDVGSSGNAALANVSSTTITGSGLGVLLIGDIAALKDRDANAVEVARRHRLVVRVRLERRLLCQSPFRSRPSSSGR
jgi:hypothetical protein